MLSGFELAELRDDPVTAIHLISEASRLAFADRNLYLGDPQFVAAPVAALLDERYLESRAKAIDLKTALPSVAAGVPNGATAWNYAPAVSAERPSTSHFSIVDRTGDAVAMTTSVQGAFGSQLMVGGFILNNQLTDFEYEPEAGGKPVANRIEGGKRPLSSMAPTLVLDAQGRLRLLVGSPGGTRIIGFVAQTIVGVLDFGLDVQQAVAAPHFLAQEGPIELEEGTAVGGAGRRAQGPRPHGRAARSEQRAARHRDRLWRPASAVERRGPAPRGRRARRLAARHRRAANERGERRSVPAPYFWQRGQK